MTVKSEVRQRTHMISVRLNDDEHARYTALAAEKGMSLPELMRLSVDVVLMHEQVRETAALHLLACRTCGTLRHDCTLSQSNGGPNCCRECRHG